MWFPFGCSCVLILRCILDILPPNLSCAASTHGELYLSMLGVCACYESRDAMLYSANGFLPLYGPCRGHNLYNLRLWRGRVGYFAAVYSMPQERPYWTCSHVVYASVEVSEHVIVSNEIKFRFFLLCPPLCSGVCSQLLSWYFVTRVQPCCFHLHVEQCLSILAVCL